MCSVCLTASINSKSSSRGFAAVSESLDIHSSIPTEYAIQLMLPSVKQSVTVTAPNTLIDPDQAGSVNQIGSEEIQDRLGSVPGRSLQDLVNSQPGWLYEGNAVLHPRGSEYQTQFVVDGIPLTDNRSPSFGPAMDADDRGIVEHLHGGHSRGVWTKDGRRGRSKYASGLAARFSRPASAFRRQLRFGGALPRRASTAGARIRLAPARVAP